MIELGLTDFFVLLIAGPFLLCGVAGVWRRVRERRARVTSRRGVMRCRYCGTPFPRSLERGVEGCPRCHLENQVGRDRRLG